MLPSLGGPADAVDYFGTAGNDTINGGPNAVRRSGRSGDDTLSGWASGEYVDGEDTLTAERSGAAPAIGWKRNAYSVSQLALAVRVSL